MEEEYKKIREIVINDPVYVYRGNISHREAKSILEEVESLIREKGESRFRKNSTHVLVELLQNATGHNVKNTKAKLLVKIFEDKLFYMCENEMDGFNVSVLTEKLIY